MERVGAARIYFADGAEPAQFDEVDIHSSGMVRASKQLQWTDADRGPAVAEIGASYFAPQAWSRIEPASCNDCMLWVCDMPEGSGFAWDQLAVCVSRDVIVDLVVQYLREHYPEYSGRERNLMNEALSIGGTKYVLLKDDHGRTRKVAFSWARATPNGSLAAQPS